MFKSFLNIFKCGNIKSIESHELHQKNDNQKYECIILRGDDITTKISFPYYLKIKQKMKYEKTWMVNIFNIDELCKIQETYNCHIDELNLCIIINDKKRNDIFNKLTNIDEIKNALKRDIYKFVNIKK